MADLAMNTYALSLPISQQSQGASTTAPDTKPKKKICCACPDTKKLRDECVVEHGEAACSKWIEAHLKCLRSEGFNV
uniref:Cytochrome c oxidase copper chaperone n=1 Tax=Kalanchoe fedtschenkoi TaxID=63787 RepID=A0A7N0T0X8_KALFE